MKAKPYRILVGNSFIPYSLRELSMILAYKIAANGWPLETTFTNPSNVVGLVEGSAGHLLKQYGTSIKDGIASTFLKTGKEKEFFTFVKNIKDEGYMERVRNLILAGYNHSPEPVKGGSVIVDMRRALDTSFYTKIVEIGIVTENVTTMAANNIEYNRSWVQFGNGSKHLFSNIDLTPVS